MTEELSIGQQRRVLGVWLDGFSFDLADRFELPFLAALGERGAVATIDSGGDQLTGLTGEHLATGIGPADGGRAAAVRFDPATYECIQLGTDQPPVFGGVPTTVLDPCYFDLDGADPSVQGVVDWGAHDPGTWATTRPAGLGREIEQRFGRYPAAAWTYATPWASVEQTEAMGIGLVDGVKRRGELARWLLGERLGDWQLAVIGFAEAHSGTEGLYHGVDPSPRWLGCASREVAARGLEATYRAIDDEVGAIAAAHPDAVLVVFSLHGMGPNNSDVPSMVLLGELMRRWHGDPTPACSFPVDEHGLPQLAADASWTSAVRSALGEAPNPRSLVQRVAGRLAQVRGSKGRSSVRTATVEWLPLMRHRAHWPQMRAFALPSYYDGRVRLNVAGREAHGCVSPADYLTVLDEIEQMLGECTDVVGGHPALDAVHRPFDDPSQVGPDDADLIISWAPEVNGLDHPTLGTIGPVPPRRSGGHTSPIGRMLASGPGIEAAALGTRASVDVVPTLLGISGSTPTRVPSGKAIDLGQIPA